MSPTDPSTSLPDAAAASRLLAALGEEPAPPTSPVPGYLIDRRIARGGTSTVYRAFRAGSDHPVALKIIHADVGHALSRARREFDTLSQLHLPCVPRLLDHGPVDHGYYIATEYIEGEPPDVFAKTLERRARCELLAKIAEAVQSLHEYGVIHRDLKPANILITPRGQPMILDLGLAVLAEHAGRNSVTVDGQALGTPAFMSPEQARGETRRITIRSDLYSLGALAWLLLLGRTPHDTQAPLHEAVRRVAQDAPPPARSLDAALPKPLAAILEKATAREPEARYAGARELAEDLRRYLRGEPVLAGSPSAWTRATRWAGRRPVLTAWLGAVAVVCMTLGGAAGVVWWSRGRPASLYVNDRRTSAVILSAVGEPLHEWRINPTYHDGGGNAMVEWPVWLPKTSRSGAVIALGFGYVPQYGYMGELCLFDPANPQRPFWHSGLGPPHVRMPEECSAAWVKAGRQENYRLKRIEPMDIFPDDVSPGEEIVAVFLHANFSPNVVQVRSQRGDLLYEAWHDGAIFDVHWLARPGLLVCAGVNSEVDGRYRVLSPRENGHPFVFFALRPRVGVLDGRVQTPTRAGKCQPTWYRAVVATRLVKGSQDPARAPKIGLSIPHDLSRERFIVNLAFVNPSSPSNPETGGGVTWVIGPEGLPEQGDRAIISDRLPEILGNGSETRESLAGLFVIRELPDVEGENVFWTPW